MAYDQDFILAGREMSGHRYMCSTKLAFAVLSILQGRLPREVEVDQVR